MTELGTYIGAIPQFPVNSAIVSGTMICSASLFQSVGVLGIDFFIDGEFYATSSAHTSDEGSTLVPISLVNTLNKNVSFSIATAASLTTKHGSVTICPSSASKMDVGDQINFVLFD